MYKVVGNLWNDKNLEIISNGFKFYVLNNWNGEKYYECWEVKDNKGLEKVNNIEYIITPVYKTDDEEMEIIDYNIE